LKDKLYIFSCILCDIGKIQDCWCSAALNNKVVKLERKYLQPQQSEKEALYHYEYKSATDRNYGCILNYELPEATDLAKELYL
jgi:hypothetical protein